MALRALVKRLLDFTDRGRVKSEKMAYILWLPPLGWFGAHRFYLGRRESGVAMLVVAFSLVLTLSIFAISTSQDTTSDESGISLITFIYSLILIGLLVPLWFIDGILTLNLVRRHNLKLANSGGKPPQQTNLSSDKRVNSKKVKKMATAYALWLPPLGLFGIHRFYAGRRTSGLMMMVLSTTFALFMPITLIWSTVMSRLGSTVGEVIFGYGFFILGASILAVLWQWWLIDSFLTSVMIEDANRK